MLKTCPPDLTILLEIYIYWTYSDYKRMDRPYSIYFIQNVDHWTSCLAVLLTIYFLPATLLNLARSILRQNMRSLSYYWMLWTPPVTISTLSPEVPNVVVLQKGPQPEETRETVHPVTVLAVASPLTWGPPHQTVEGGSEPHYKTIPLRPLIDLTFLCTESVIWYQVKHASFEGLTAGEMVVR